MTTNNVVGSQPRHIAIVMDGNGRWAQQRHRPRTFGHRAGVKAVRAAVEFCRRRGVEALTLFAFSSENWQRPQTEVSALMDLFLRALEREVDDLHNNGVRLQFVGALQAFPDALRRRMQAATARTAANTSLTVSVAVNYGGRWDIAQATQAIALAAIRGEIQAESITPETLAPYLCLSDLPAPDLFIRTGGERRISNFLLWQLAYCELYFIDTLWPDVDAACLDGALLDFAQRERRYGKTSAQVARAS